MHKHIQENERLAAKTILIIFIAGNAIFFTGIFHRIIPIDVAIVDIVIGICLILWILLFKSRIVIIFLFCLWLLVKSINVIYIVELLPVAYGFSITGLTFFIIGITTWVSWVITIGIIFTSLVRNSMRQKLNEKEFIIPTNVDNVCEKLHYLQDNGFTVEQLISIHHFDKQTFQGVIKYFCDAKKWQDNNIKFANRVIFIAENHEKNNKDFGVLIDEALKIWSLN